MNGGRLVEGSEERVAGEVDPCARADRYEPRHTLSGRDDHRLPAGGEGAVGARRDAERDGPGRSLAEDQAARASGPGGGGEGEERERGEEGDAAHGELSATDVPSFGAPEIPAIGPFSGSP